MPAGALYVRVQGSRWVILAGDPEVKMDNMHADGRPHLHLGGWDSPDRQDLRPGLTARKAADAVAAQLLAKGYLDPRSLVEVLS